MRSSDDFLYLTKILNKKKSFKINIKNSMNTMFKKKRIHKNTFVMMAHGRMVEKAVMDYVVVSKRVNGRVLDVNVLRGESGGMSDHYLVESLLRIDGMWNKRKRGGHRERVRLCVRSLPNVL